MAVTAKAITFDERDRNHVWDSGAGVTTAGATYGSQDMKSKPEGNAMQDFLNFLRNAAGSGAFGTLGQSEDFVNFIKDNDDIIKAVAGGAATASDVSTEHDEDYTTPQNGNSAKPIVYSDWSPAAQQFGMDQQTAYAEHMANTAHQREVADLRAAGLNPVLGVGSGASGVTGHVVTSGSSAQKSLNGDFIVDAIGATAAVVTAILTKNPAYGYMAGNAVNAVGDYVTYTKNKN